MRIDPAALHKYAEAVYAAVDEYLATLSDDELSRPIDLTALGLGQQTLGSLLTIMVIHGGVHTGEISVTKGLQGLQGYPF